MTENDVREILRLDNIDDATIEAFLLWHKRHIDVWTEFEKLALELIGRGVKHYGAGAIAEVIRFHRSVNGGTDFKMNNNFRAYYARVFAGKYPQHANFFETREAKGLKRAA